MRITLVNPPFEEQYSVGSSKSMRLVLNRIPPLGLAYLAAVLRSNNHRVNIVDFTVASSLKAGLREIDEADPQIIGITSTTPTFESAKSLSRQFKKNIPGAVRVIGGPHVTAMPQEAMQTGCFDAGVIGEAEETFLSLVRHLDTYGLSQLNSVSGIIFPEANKCMITQRREFIKDLDSLPYPARDLLPALSRYIPTPASYRRLPLGVIMTSRGCPHQCTFCDRAVFGNVYRARSAENVLGEVEEVINKYGAREIRFFDDCFTLDHARTEKICRGLRDRFPGLPWTCLTTVSSVTKGLLKQMKASGCWQVLFGLESGDESMLALLKKNAKLSQNIDAVTWAKQAGLSVRGDFIVGTPGETEETLKKTLQCAINMGLEYAHFNKFVPYPGTALYQELTGRGYSFDFGKGCSITDHSRVIFTPPAIDADRYRRFINEAHKKFYLRPEYIVKRLCSIKTLDELYGQVKGFFSISQLE